MKQRSDRSNGTSEIERKFLSAYDEHADALFRHCVVRVRDKDVATDIVQETYTKTWNYLSEGKEIQHFKAFLYRVANNLIVDGSRKKKSASLDAMMDEDAFEVLDETIKDPGDIGDARQALGLLAKLDEMYRVVITLRFVDGLSPKEIAHTLAISENVASVRIHRGIEKLKSMAIQLGYPD